MTSIDRYRSALAEYNAARTEADRLLAEYKAAERRHMDACGLSVAAYDKLKAARAQWETEALMGTEGMT